MDEIIAGWQMGEVLISDIAILWLVDVSGHIWFAIEELVIAGTPQGVPKHQTIELTRNADKLGHPALVASANARIGGEIQFEPRRLPPGWEINNRSARYGAHSSRSAAHLDNAAEIFSRYGIDVSPRFVRPR